MRQVSLKPKHFLSLQNTVSSMCVHCSYDTIMLLNAVTVYGVGEKPVDVRFNKQSTNFTYNPSGQVSLRDCPPSRVRLDIVTQLRSVAFPWLLSSSCWRLHKEGIGQESDV